MMLGTERPSCLELSFNSVSLGTNYVLGTGLAAGDGAVGKVPAFLGGVFPYLTGGKQAACV